MGCAFISYSGGRKCYIVKLNPAKVVLVVAAVGPHALMAEGLENTDIFRQSSTIWIKSQQVDMMTSWMKAELPTLHAWFDVCNLRKCMTDFSLIVLRIIHDLNEVNEPVAKAEDGRDGAVSLA